MPKFQTVWKDEELSPIRDKVYQFIKQAIVSGDYKSGDRIIERELAEQLKVSRTPIREALFRLESQGFIKTLPRKGVVVSRLSPEEIIEIFTILSALESLAVKLAALNTNEQYKKELDQIIQDISRALDENHYIEDWSTFHFTIHSVVSKASNSPRLNEMLDSLSDYIRAFVYVGYELPGRMRKAMEEHRDLAQAIRNGQAELAENLTKIHLENSKQAYMEALNRQ
jgi:DNA-binding GntR family transcriptional regulator